jgi:Uma2 family endonuclease
MGAVSYIPRYSVDDFLQWEGEWELWDGVPVSMSPAPGFFHQSVGSQLIAQLVDLLHSDDCEGSCRAVYESDWHLEKDTVVRPDVMVVCGDPGGKWLKKRPEFTAEILSPSTRQKDLVAKRELYASEGVPHYLILDPEDKSALLLQLGEDGTYREIAPESSFELHPGCKVELSIGPLFA